MWFDGTQMEPPKPARRGSLRERLYKSVYRAHVSLYRMTGGRIGGRWQGAPVLLLTYIGRKSGKLRTTPLIYGEDGDSLVVVASNAGTPGHPAWYLSILEDLEVEVDVGKHTSVRHARVAEGEERERLFRMMNDVYKHYDLYQERAADSREIPVVVLEREPGLED
jgi:deazaflavin-dependent oxidoreductase (nitroreductase family)